MHTILSFTIRLLRKLVDNGKATYPLKYEGYLNLKDQQANDYVYAFLADATAGKGKMIAKFGTIELSHIIACHYELNRWNGQYFKDILHRNASFDSRSTLRLLCSNAGFFPCDAQLGMQFYERMLKDMPEIDVLGSYIYQERYIDQFLTEVKKRINLD